MSNHPDDLEYLSDMEMDEYEKLMAQEEAYQSFQKFIKMTMPNYDFNWHHMVMINRLNELIHQKDQRIMIFMPPRNGKSELVSRRYPAWYLGRMPDSEIIACSYSSGLANMFSRDVQRIMEMDVYHEIFPDSMIPDAPFSKGHPLNNKTKRTADYFELLGRKGSMLSAGVNGPITGFGGDLLLIDDPVKNEEEAMSETYREKTINWYNSTAYTRLEGGANIVVCQTRWHKGDLSGKLIAEMESGGDKWEIISLPAISSEKVFPNDPRSPGEPLWPNKYPLERLEIIKRQVGARVWSSMFQQNPVIEGGNIIKETWFQYYHSLPFDVTNWRECHIVQSWDLNFKETGKSYVVGVCIAKHGIDYYLLDMFREKVDFVETGEAIMKMKAKYPACKAVLIEEKANGSAILSYLKKKVSNLIPIQATASKDERLHSVSPTFEAGNFHIPANHPMSKVVVDEMISFPNAENDDIPDAISQGLLRFMDLKGLARLRAITKW